MRARVKEDRSAPPALPPFLLLPIGVVAVLAALVVAMLGVLYSGDATPGTFDEWTPSATDGVRPPLRNAALVIDFGGEPLGAAMLLAALAAGCLVLDRRRTAVLTVAGAGSTVAATTLLKPLVGRTIHGSHLSFPSGHTALATALALALALLAVDLLRAGKLAGVLLTLAVAGTAGVAMAWSQVALGAHYPTDTLGGFCTALAVVPATAWLVDSLADRRAGAG